MLDIILLLILAAVTWCVAGEGVWGGGLVLLSVVFSGLLAMNFFESLAGLFPSSGTMAYFSDFVCLVGIFGVSVTLLRMATEYLMPVYVEVLPLLYDVGRWAMGLATGYITMAFMATAIQTAPLPRDLAGKEPTLDDKMFFGIGPDIQWLGFTQFVSEKIFTGGQIFDGERFPQVLERGDAEGNIQIWSSFPMRYAARREQFIATGGAGSPTGGSAPKPSAPSAPPPGGGGGGPAF